MNYYEVWTDEGKRKKYAYGIEMNDYELEKINCAVCRREWEDDPLLTSQIKLKIILSNSYYADFILSGYFQLISQKGLDILINEGITGWRYEEIEMLSKRDLTEEKRRDIKDGYGYRIYNSIPDDPPKYYKILANKTARLHPKSNVILTGKCDVCGYEMYEKRGDVFAPDYLDKESWNGDDLFGVIQYGTSIYCTQDFVHIYNKYALTGLIFDSIESL